MPKPETPAEKSLAAAVAAFLLGGEVKPQKDRPSSMTICLRPGTSETEEGKAE